MTSVFRISLDIHQTQSQVSIPATQGADNVRLIIRLTEKGNPFDIDDGSYAIFSAVKPDGNPLYNDCAIYRNSTIVYDFTPQTTAVEGITKCQIHLYDTYGRKLHSPRFQIVVHPDIYGNEIESTAEYEALAAFVGIKNDIEQDISNNASAIIALQEKVTTAGSVTIPASEWTDTLPKLAFPEQPVLAKGTVALLMPGNTASQNAARKAKITVQSATYGDGKIVIQREDGEAPTGNITLDYVIITVDNPEAPPKAALVGVDAYGEGGGGTASGVDESAVRAIIAAMLGNVANVRQYSADNPPPYPVTSVNCKTGVVNLNATDVGARPSTWMPTAADVNADQVGTAERKTAALRDEVNTELTEYDKSTAVNKKVSDHNTNNESHSDIRVALQNLLDIVTSLLNCDDETLNETKEIVEYAKANRGLIESITTSKVSVADVVNNLVTSDTKKPLSAAQGVALKDLIDTLAETVNGKQNASQVNTAIINALKEYAKASAIPTKLSQLEEDSTHRTVTDEEKSGWNSKADGNHNHDGVYAKPSDIPTVPQTLPNPYALTILGKTYNGSSAVALTVEEIIEAIKAASGGVAAYLDGNKLVLSGNLPDATYTAYYEVDGELVKIGDLTLGAVTPEPVTYTVTFVADGVTVAEVEYAVGDTIEEPAVPAKDGYTGVWETYDLTKGGNITVNAVYTAIETGPSYTNLIPLSTDASGNPYNGGQGWKTGYRLNSSGVEVALANIEVTGFMPLKLGDTVYIKNITDDGTHVMALYDSAYAKLATLQFSTVFGVCNGELASKAINQYLNTQIEQAGDKIAYMRISANEITANSIVTVNENIE